MKKSLVHLLIVLMLFCWLPDVSAAKTGYVSDLLFLTFRQGPGTTHEVIKRLPSDTPVVILEENEEYYKVKLDSDEIGWVDKRFISFEIPKSMVIHSLTQKNTLLENKIQDLEDRIQSIQNPTSGGDNDAVHKIMQLETLLKTARDEAEKTNQSLFDHKEKYNLLIEQSGNIQKIIMENKALQEKNDSLSKEILGYQSKSQGPLKTDMIKWALFGVGILLLGWLFGHSVSIGRRRKESSLRI